MSDGGGEIREVRYVRRGVYARKSFQGSPDFIIRREKVHLSTNALTRDLAMDMLGEKLAEPRHSGRRGNPKPNAAVFFDQNGHEVLAVSESDILARLHVQSV